MQNTVNYNLKKPESNEFVNVDDINGNMDIIDEQLKNIDDSKVTKIDGKGLSTNDYTTAEKEKLATLNNYDDSGLRQEILTKADKNTVYTKQETDSKLTEQKNYIDTSKNYTLTHTKLGTVHTLSDLPTGQGIYQCQFIATADYNEGDTFTDYTAKPTGEETILTNKVFVTGDLVSFTVDTVNKKLGFKIGGSGVNQTLPPQIRSFAVTSGNAKNTLSWVLPIDTTAYEGLLIIRKVGSAPTKLSDGTKISMSKTATSYTDTGLTNDTKYYYRAFPYNSKKQYQTDIVGAVVSGTPKAVIPISSLPIGTLIKDVNTKYYNQPIVWKIVDQNHAGYPTNSTTLMSEKILTSKCFDAKEPSNRNSNRREYGNNRYSISNIRQWLNSNASAGNWYSAQHDADAPPNFSNVSNNRNEYETEEGFLKGFSSNMVTALFKTTITMGKSDVDGGETETYSDKIFLASCTEIGVLGNHICGNLLPIFSSDTTRQAYPTAECVAHNELSSPSFNIGSPQFYWLRDAYVSTSCRAWFVTSSGTLSDLLAYTNGGGIRPLCNIKNDTLVSLQPDTDGAYIIQF